MLVDHQQFKAIPGSQVTQKWIVDTKSEYGVETYFSHRWRRFYRLRGC